MKSTSPVDMTFPWLDCVSGDSLEGRFLKVPMKQYHRVFVCCSPAMVEVVLFS